MRVSVMRGGERRGKRRFWGVDEKGKEFPGDQEEAQAPVRDITRRLEPEVASMLAWLGRSRAPLPWVYTHSAPESGEDRSPSSTS